MVPQTHLTWTSSEPIEISQIKELIANIHAYFNDGNLVSIGTGKESIIHLKEMLSNVQQEKSRVIFQGCIHYLNENLQSFEPAVRQDNKTTMALRK